MDEREYAELLTHLRARTREAGALVLDDAIAAALLEGEQPPSEAVVFYLEQLHGVLRLRSGRAASEALTRLREYVTTDDGGPVEGLELRTGDEWQVFGEGVVDMTAPSMPPDAVEEALAGIAGLIEALRSEDPDRASEPGDRERADDEPEGGGEFEEER